MKHNHRVLLATLFVFLLYSVAFAGVKPFPTTPQCGLNWPSPIGYPTDKIRDSSGWHEPDWNDWIAVQMGLDLDENTQVRCPSGKRVDILTDTHAIEVEWAHHWLEAPGQAGHYKLQFNREKGAVIVLSNGSPRDEEQVEHLRAVCELFGLELYVQRIPVKERQ